MLNGHERSDTTLFLRKVMLDMRNMRAELNEHRHRLELIVEHRTEHLLKRIALLESCNAALCGKLAAAHKELAVLKQQPAHILPEEGTESDGRTVKLYVMNTQAQEPAGTNVQDSGGGYVAAL